MGLVLDTVTAVVSRLVGVSWWLLALALAVHLLALVLRARAWQEVLAADYPLHEVRFRRLLAAYLAGNGANAVIPAKGGELVKALLARRVVPGAAYAALLASLGIVILIDAVVTVALCAWGVSSGRLPGPRTLLGYLSAGGWLLAHPHLALALLLVALGLGFVAWRLLAARLGGAAAEVRRGLSALRDGRRLTSALLWQTLAWVADLGALWLFLAAFSIPASFETVLALGAVQGLGALLPLAGGSLALQALVVFVLSGQVGALTAIGFFLGMRATLAATHVATGVAAAGALLGTYHPRRLLAGLRPPLADVRAERARV